MRASPKQPTAIEMLAYLRNRPYISGVHIADCACAGLPEPGFSLNCEETWGEEWRDKRQAAMQVADRIARQLMQKPRKTR
jgi:hypothetical protein